MTQERAIWTTISAEQAKYGDWEYKGFGFGVFFHSFVYCMYMEYNFYF